MEHKLWLRFNVWYVALTTLYTFLVFSGQGPIFAIDCCSKQGTIFSALIGLFVPIGPNNFWALIFALTSLVGPFFGKPFVSIFYGVLLLFPFILVIESLLFGEKSLARWNYSIPKKISANLILLLLLTFVSDLILTGTWQSMDIFLHSVGTTFGFPIVTIPNLTQLLHNH